MKNKKRELMFSFFYYFYKREVSYFYIYSMRKCLYVNCDREVIGRSNKKYCCLEHKRIQKKYRQRTRKRNVNNESL